MDAKRPFLAEGISAIVGLAGITKAVKGKAQESKPKSHAGDNQSNTSGAKGQGPKINGQQSDPVKVIVAKGTVKVAAGTKVAHAVEGVGSVKNISQLSPNDIRFSQNTVSFNKVDRLTGQKYTYDDLVGSMRKNGWQGDPVDVVKMQDGKLTSMDNTRIRAAREAGIDVKANVRNFTDPLTPEVQKARGWERYRTWGEALKGRIDNQSGKFGSNYPYGANDLPKVRGKQ